jgi:2-polyprenyl-6-hydroxyphenyl methylase/3-demethylubiquinone-9 3-methyltransferase
VIALDGSDAMIAIAEQSAASEGLRNITHRVGLLDELAGWESAQFELILSSSVLEYVDDYQAALASLVRLLRPGGRMIISMPNADSLYRRIEGLAFGLTGRPRYVAHLKSRSTPGELEDILASQGMEILETRYFADPPVPQAILPMLGGEQRRKSLFVQVAALALT